jgi:uncharacterized protein YoxC
MNILDWRLILLAIATLLVLVNAALIIAYSVRAKRAGAARKNLAKTVTGLQQEIKGLFKD